jgi:hypothetical protein
VGGSRRAARECGCENEGAGNEWSAVTHAGDVTRNILERSD